MSKIFYTRVRLPRVIKLLEGAGFEVKAEEEYGNGHTTYSVSREGRPDIDMYTSPNRAPQFNFQGADEKDAYDPVFDLLGIVQSTQY